MRILHVLDAGRAGKSAALDAEARMLTCASVIERSPHVTHEVLLVGGGPSGMRGARASGLDSIGSLPAPCGGAWTAWNGLRRVIADRGHPDVLHVWGARLLTPARLAFRGPRTATIFESPFRSGALFGRSASGRARAALGGVRTIFLTERTRRVWTELGVEGSLSRPHPITPRFITPAERAEIRRSLGIGDDQMLLVPLPGGRGTIDAGAAGVLFGFVREMGVLPFHAILPSSAKNSDRAFRMLEVRGRSWSMRPSDRPMSTLLSIADLAVCVEDAATPRDVGGDVAAAFIVNALARAVPVVTSLSLDGHLPEELRKTCQVQAPTIPDVARRLYLMIQNRARYERASAQARAAAKALDPAPMIETYRSLWSDAGRTPSARGVPA